MNKLLFWGIIMLLTLPFCTYGQYVLEEEEPQSQKTYSSLEWLDKDFKKMSFSNYSKGVFYAKVNYEAENGNEYDLIFDVHSDHLISVNEVKSGENHGEFFLFDQSKRLRIKGNYKNGIKTGQWVDYFFYDSFIKEYTYNNNRELVTTVRTQKGDTILIKGEGTIKFQVGKHSYYHELYKNGVLDYSYISNQSMDTTYIKTHQSAVLKSDDELRKYLKKCLKGIKYEIYHQMELKMWVLVDKDGNVTDVELKEGFTDLLNRNLIKGLKETKGLWKGAILNNEVVPSFYEYSVLLFDIIKPIKSKDLNTPMIIAHPASGPSYYDLTYNSNHFFQPNNIDAIKRNAYNSTSRNGVLSHSHGGSSIRSDNSSTIKKVRKAKRLELKDMTKKKLKKVNFEDLLKRHNVISYQ
ncbi:hypothetical protein [Flammeovirga sp. SJP92]|uniref:hypothetical protein n=1 Tax=Flammeovirga sp. SJP92 TaxID=1775430 RepID=UPI00079489F1|nr:hypothetical protein [Flammeovirga sp. SJP92]KXX72635.1 hypothetical protein AVL50_06435 [Flammeovirga sp. SJP92]